MKERPDFDEYAENTLAEFKERAACIRKSYSWTKYWESCSLDDYKADIGRYVDCGNCPLFKDLRETNNTRSFTVIPCDFRGEQVLHVPGLPDEFINEALEKHSPEEMLDYAKRLEFWLEDMRDSGKLVKPPCEEQYTNLSSTTKQTIEMAIHWLRVCSKWELWMATTY